MRYTTVIDISEIPEIYRNKNVCRLYFHLALKSGYHDDDRDIVHLSVRGMCYGTGLSLSAVRHALLVLEKHELLERVNGYWKVKKFVVEQTVTKRARKRREIDTGTAINEALNEERESRIKAGEKTSWMLLYEMRQRQAKNGDASAAKFVREHAQQYREQCEQLKNEIKGNERT